MKEGRIVFRHQKTTVEAYKSDDRWVVSVQGEEELRGPFDSPGKAVEAGIEGAEARSKARSQRPKRKKKTAPTLRIDRKYLRIR